MLKHLRVKHLLHLPALFLSLFLGQLDTPLHFIIANDSFVVDVR